MRRFKIFFESDHSIKVTSLIKEVTLNSLLSYNSNQYIDVVSAVASVRIYPIVDYSYSFAICPQSDDLTGWKIFRSFGNNTKNSETIEILGPDDLNFFYRDKKS